MNHRMNPIHFLFFSYLSSYERRGISASNASPLASAFSSRGFFRLLFDLFRWSVLFFCSCCSSSPKAATVLGKALVATGTALGAALGASDGVVSVDSSDTTSNSSALNVEEPELLTEVIPGVVPLVVPSVSAAVGINDGKTLFVGAALGASVGDREG